MVPIGAESTARTGDTMLKQFALVIRTDGIVIGPFASEALALAEAISYFSDPLLGITAKSPAFTHADESADFYVAELKAPFTVTTFKERSSLPVPGPTTVNYELGLRGSADIDDDHEITGIRFIVNGREIVTIGTVPE